MKGATAKRVQKPAGGRGPMRRVLVLSEMHSKPDRLRLFGVLRYAALHPDWEVEVFPEHPANYAAPDASENFDGLITTGFFLKTVSGAGTLGRVRPAVVLDLGRAFDAPDNVAVIREDNHAVGARAAAFFLRKGLRAFAYIGTPQPRHWSDERREGFAARLAAAGHSVHVYAHDAAAEDWTLERGAIIAFLRALPKPCGVFTAFDERAKQVLNACRAGGIAVPEQVGVLGVNNEEFICETAVPTLSSIEPELEESGYRAAEALDRMMRGGTAERDLSYGVKGIVERLSTADLSGASRIVAIADEFIRRNASAEITPADIAVACRCSLRLLQRSFAKVTGESPAARLRRERLARVCDLLKRTRTPVGDIGALCGLPNAKHLKSLFKKTHGVTMRAYRAGVTRP